MNKLILMVMISASSLFAQNITLAVFDFEVGGISDSEASQIQDKLINEFVNIGKFDIVERKYIDAVLMEQDLQQTGCVADTCLVQIGKIAGAEQIVVGSLGKVGTIFAVSARIINVETGKAIGSVSLEFQSIEVMLTDGMVRVARELSGIEQLSVVDQESEIDQKPDVPQQTAIRKKSIVGQKSKVDQKSRDNLAPAQSSDPFAELLIKAIDDNMSSENQVMTSKMIVHGRRASRTIVSKSWVIGNEMAFTEYLSPPREAGTKMLKTKDKLWTYSPQTDRIIQISGHMLRQSVMGSDMSYTDMMEDRTLLEMYNATIEGSEMIKGRKHWILYLDAKVDDVSYPKRRSWVDAEYLIPMKEELYAKSGKLLKSSTIGEVMKVDGRWYPKSLIFKDELKRNSKGTEWVIDTIEFDVDIPESRFQKSGLRK